MVKYQNMMQGVLHWVAQPSPGLDPLKVEVRLFDKLFLSEVNSTLLSQEMTFLENFLVQNIHDISFHASEPSGTG